MNAQVETDYNIQATDINNQFTDINVQSTTLEESAQLNDINVQTTTDYNIENNANIAESTNININQYVNQGEIINESVPTILTNQEETTQNIDPSLLRPSLKILQPKITQTVLPPLAPQGETYNYQQFGNFTQNMGTTEFETVQTGMETNTQMEVPLTENVPIVEQELNKQEVEIKEEEQPIQGELKIESNEEELIQLREENKKMKQELSELKTISSQIQELNQLKAQIEEMNKKQEQLIESSNLKQKEGEDEKEEKEEKDEKEEKEEKEENEEKEEKELEQEQEQEEQNIKNSKQDVSCSAESKQKVVQVKGDIITDIKELELITRKINKMNKKITLNLLYKATVDSDKAASFHEKCDKAKSSLVLVETDKGKRFGGFTTCSWEGDCIEKKDPDAFVFSLDKMACYDNIHGEDAIGCYPKFGPIFMGCQIRIFDNAFTKGGTTYEKGLNYNTEEDFELTGGDRVFGVKDIEVYEVIAE